MRCKRLCAILLALCLCLPLWGCGQDTISEEKIKISFIAKSTTSDFWHNVFSGVNSAATEYNVSVNIQGPENEEDYETQNTMIAAAVDAGSDAIVLSAIDYYNSVDAVDAAVKAGVKVVIVDSSVNTDKVSLVIGTDNYAAGVTTAEALLAQQTRQDMGPLCIGLVNYDINSANGQERERGFRDRMAQAGEEIVETVNVDSNTEDATNGALGLMARHPAINALVGFNEWMTLGIGYAIEQSGVSDTVAGIGFDSNIVSIGMLETGEMDALVVQNPFAMGYLGIQNAYSLVTGKTIKELWSGQLLEPSSPQEEPQTRDAGIDIPTATTVVTRENMFEENSQKTLFKFG
jgi:ribose transport system substrate-binding protein